MRLSYRYGETIEVRHLCDLHYSSPLCDRTSAKRYITENPECYYIVTGDIFDLILPSDLKRYVHGANDGESPDLIDTEVEAICDLLSPISGRVLCWSDGNHESEVLKRHHVNVTKRVCAKLGVRYVGHSCVLRLLLTKSEDQGGGGGRSVFFHCHHGYGASSRTAGGSLTKYEKAGIAWPDADFHVRSHDHSMVAKPIAQLRWRGEAISDDLAWLVLGGTFLKTYSGGTGCGYGEQKLYNPAVVGQVIMEVRPERTGVRKNARYWIA